MHRSLNICLAAIVVCMLALVPACSNKQPEAEQEGAAARDSLREIWALYDFYVKEKKKPPTRLADFKPYSAGFALGYEALSNGSCVAIWRVDLSAPADDSTQVIAYEKEVPTQGGQVVLKDGTLTKMTAEAFQALPKAKN